MRSVRCDGTAGGGGGQALPKVTAALNGCVMKLFRATKCLEDATDIPTGSCWSPDLAVAEVYTENPGWGGPHIVSIDTNDAFVDLRGHDRRGVHYWDLAPLANLLNEDVNRWERMRLLTVFKVLEEVDGVAKQLKQRGYRWAVYWDDHPPNAVVWMRL